jgi:hypothetical protein
MRQEATNWVPVVAAGIGALAALAGQVVAGLFQGRNQKRAERTSRRERAAEVVGAAFGVLMDSQPGVLTTIDDFDEAEKEVEELHERLQVIRGQLWVLSVDPPSGLVGDLSRELSNAMWRSLAATTAAMTAHRRATGVDAALERAEREYNAAQTIITRLMLTIQKT